MSKQPGQDKPQVPASVDLFDCRSSEEPAAHSSAMPVADTTQEAESTVKELPKKNPLLHRTTCISPKLEITATYEGEIELAIAGPVDLASVSKLYSYLQTAPDIKVLYTRGFLGGGAIIALTLDKSLPLIDMISKIPCLSIALALPRTGNLVMASACSLLMTKGKTATKIDLQLRSE